MALDFQSRVTADQKGILSDFVEEEVPKAGRRKKRLDFLAGKVAKLRDSLDALQNEDLKFLSSTTKSALGTDNKAVNYIPPEVQEKTLAGFKRQTSQVEGGVPRAPTTAAGHFTKPFTSVSVDDIKTPLLEVVKGRFERLEYAIRRTADRTEVLEFRAAKQVTLQTDLSVALKKIQVQE